MKEFIEIDWDSMTFSNNLVFLEVMKNKELCKHLIEYILHIQIKDIIYLETDKNLSVRIDSKRIRLDVYVMDENGTVLDIEMQTTGPNSTIYRDTDEETVVRELPLRTRYYQSIASMDMLRRGMHYNELRRSYVIFICTFDPFKEGLPVYHFTYRSRENNALEMGDLTENIFLNARAADKAKDKELAAFLSYVNGKAPESEFTQTVEKETARVRDDTYWRERIMTWEMDMKVIEKRMEKRMEKTISERLEKTISERLEKEYEEKARSAVKEAAKEAAVKAEMENSLGIAKALCAKGTMTDAEIAEVTNLSVEEVAALR